MTLRPSFARPIAATSCALTLAVLAASFGCGESSNPSGPSNTPVVRLLSPATGTSFGGTEVTITGEKFVAGSVVSFGGTPGVNVAVENGSVIRATTPAHASGVVDVVVSGSSGSATLPQSFTFVAPGSGNTPPVIKSMTAKGRKPNEPRSFADLSETLDLTAAVEDAETASDKLTYQWTTTLGTVTGTGAAVTWAAPGSAPTPVDVTITLTVVETYKAPDATGLPVDKENKVSSTTTVSLHNSLKEIGDMAYQFLVLFSNSAITDPNIILRDFSSQCPSGTPGPAGERKDIIDNRTNYVIQPDYVIGAPSVTVNFGGSCTLFSDRPRPADACALVNTEWHSKVINPPTDPNYNKIVTAKGIDQVTARYFAPRWWLCDSDFKQTGTVLAPNFKK